MSDEMTEAGVPHRRGATTPASPTATDGVQPRGEGGAGSSSPRTPVRVLHVLEALEGGTARHLVDVVQHVQCVHHEVVLPPRRVGGVTDTLATARIEAAGATVHQLDLRRSPAQPANALAVYRLARLLRERHPAVVHAHSSIAGLVGRLAAGVRRIPAVYTPNGITEARAGLAVEAALGWTCTAQFVAVSESERLRANRLHLTHPGRVVVVPNGIDLRPTDPSDATAPPVDLRTELGLVPGTPLVGTISRLVPQKAPVDLVKAFAVVAARHPDVHFVVIGDGPLRASFADEVAHAQLQARVHQIPYLPGAAAVLDQLAVFVLASRFEGAPYAPLEAMRAGVPVVATDVTGTRDVVEHGVTGLLAPVGHPAQLGRLVADVLHDPTTRAGLQVGATERLALFDVQAMADRLGRLYLELAATPRASFRARGKEK